jgi:hypothetical protein
MNRLNFLVENLGASQLSYKLLQRAEHLSKAGHEVCIFYENIESPCLQPMVPIMNISEAWSVKGVIISTCLKTASYSLGFVGSKKRFFYIWDMSWMNNNQYEAIHSLFNNDKLILIARSSYHADIIENNFNTKVLYVDDNFENIEKIIGETNSE